MYCSIFKPYKTYRWKCCNVSLFFFFVNYMSPFTKRTHAAAYNLQLAIFDTTGTAHGDSIPRHVVLPPLVKSSLLSSLTDQTVFYKCRKIQKLLVTFLNNNDNLLKITTQNIYIYKLYKKKNSSLWDIVFYQSVWQKVSSHSTGILSKL